MKQYQARCLETTVHGVSCGDTTGTGKTEVYKDRTLAVWCMEVLHKIVHPNCHKYEVLEVE